jgi:hypothetical protein
VEYAQSLLALHAAEARPVARQPVVSWAGAASIVHARLRRLRRTLSRMIVDARA